MAWRIGIVALIVYALAVLAAVLVEPRPAVVEEAQAAARPPAPEPDEPGNPLPQLVGMGLVVYHTDQPELYHEAIDRIAELGFNSVHIVTPVFQRDGASDEIEVPVGPGRAPARAELLALLQHARQRGLITVLMPQVNFTHPRGNEWRGKLQPDRWPAWWASYERVLSDFLDLASEADVDIFCVGCELLSTQKAEHGERWQRIIDLARKRFDGALIYSTNWDSFGKVGFWDQLDAIGVSAYWNVAADARDPKAPTAAELAQRWQRIRADVQAYARSQGRPVLFTELGYPSLPWALRDPWNYVPADGVQADHQAQAAGYRAFLAAWQDLIVPPAGQADARLTEMNTPRAKWQLPDPTLAGVLFYHWDPYHQGGPDDTGYGIVNKPAYPLLERWLRAE